MKPALLLVDLQNDFLAARTLEPSAGELVRGVARLLGGCRARSVPVIHVWTTVSRKPDNRMPHWRQAGRWECVAGTVGHEPPAELRPNGEPVLDKTWFSAFSNPELDARLGQLGASDLILCGVHLHGCVRATALDGYQRGYRVWVARDGVGGYDGLHGAISARYLEGRAARVESGAALLARLDGGGSGTAEGGEDPVVGAARIAAETAASAGREWRAREGEHRAELLREAADAIEGSSESLVERIVAEVSKPRRYAEAEVTRGAALLRAAATIAEPEPERGPEADVRRLPLGLVAQITPFNNPVAVPLGKLGPALRLGNAVAWKPSPAVPGVSEQVAGLLREAGLPRNLVSVLHGGAEAADVLMRDPTVDGISITGSSAAGYAAQAASARRRVPLQAELGGNNAAIVWRDTDLASAAAAIAEAGLGFAGQRCTANRRVIVDQERRDDFVAELEAAAAALPIGDPADPEIVIGPLVSAEARERVADAVERARSGSEVRQPVDADRLRRLGDGGRYFPPTLVLCDDPDAEIVQEETFGPVIVVQPAAGFDHALELLNGVSQGLVASLFSGSPELRERFLQEARAGVLKLGRATADAGVETPFGGWKASGVGPPEHGVANLEFYTRAQAVYMRR